MNDLSAVEEYWNGVTQRLQVETDVFNRLVGHRGEMGRANELSLAQLLQSLLPNSVGIGTGVVIDSEGGRSAQSDVIVYDTALQPQILAQSTQLLFPIETVLAVIEVKTTVDDGAIQDSGQKGEKLRALRDSRDGELKPAYGLFGYRCGGAAATTAKSLMQLTSNGQPDLACVVRPGLFGTRSPTGLRMSHVPLHKRDGEQRVSQQWTRPAESKGHTTAIGGSVYPVSRFQPNASTRVVFEPGRALLLFCNALLEVLAERGVTGRNWLVNYLPPVALETVQVEL